MQGGLQYFALTTFIRGTYMRVVRSSRDTTSSTAPANAANNAAASTLLYLYYSWLAQSLCCVSGCAKRWSSENLHFS
jgi:hypothetical protein